MSFLLVLDWIVLVTMQGQKESPPDMQCRDKFLLQSVVAPDGTTTKDITSDMVGWLLCIFLCLFLFKDWRLCFLNIELLFIPVYRLTVMFAQYRIKDGSDWFCILVRRMVGLWRISNWRFYTSLANLPSPVAEESDEGSSPSRPSVFENGNQDTSLLDAVSVPSCFCFEIFFPPFCFYCTHICLLESR